MERRVGTPYPARPPSGSTREPISMRSSDVWWLADRPSGHPEGGLVRVSPVAQGPKSQLVSARNTLRSRLWRKLAFRWALSRGRLLS